MNLWKLAKKEEGALKHWIVDKMVNMRTSFTYVWVVISLVVGWILINRLHLVNWDNDVLTLLNLTLSVLAEIQGVILLIYATRISNKQNEADHSRARTLELVKKLEEMHRLAADLEQDTEEMKMELEHGYTGSAGGDHAGSKSK